METPKIPNAKAPNLPVAINPETGCPEIIGSGRIAIIKAGSATVERLVQLTEIEIPEDEFDELDELVSSGALHNS